MDSRYLSNWRSYASWHLYSSYSPFKRMLLVSQMCRDLCISISLLIAGLSIDMLSFSHSRRNNSKWIIDGSKVTSNSLFGHRTIFREMNSRKLWFLLLCSLNALKFCWGLPSHSHGFHIWFPFTNRKISTLKAMFSSLNCQLYWVSSLLPQVVNIWHGIWSLRSMFR